MNEVSELSAAMARAFAGIEGATKGKVNPAFRSRYADLAAVVDAIKPALVEHGLWFSQVTHPAEGGVCVETVIHHSSGQSMRCGLLFMPFSKPDAHGYSSALSYARRQSLMAAFGVPAIDDDGNAASQPKRPVESTDIAAATRVLAQLREAALAGPSALQDAFRALPATPEKAAVWREHAESLKAAAQAAAQPKDAQ